MKMKRIVSTLLAGVMTLSLVACGSSTPAPTDSGSTATEPAQTTEQPAQTTEPAAVESTGSSEPISLNMWCIATESDSNRHHRNKRLNY